MGFLTGKKALIVGLASNRSIAYGIAKAMHEQGAELAFTYQTEKLQDRVAKMAAAFDSELVFQCDVAEDESIANMAVGLQDYWQQLDILVHSVAYAPAECLEGDYVENINREGFRIAHDISSYSFAALAQALLPIMNQQSGAMLTMTYLGGEKAVPNYNVMGVAKASLESNMRYMANSLGARGIRVNAISAGPIRTLAASGIKNFRKMLAFNERVTPLKRNVTTQDVGNTAAFLCSDLAAGITGENVHVDAGFHAVAMNDLALLE